MRLVTDDDKAEGTTHASDLFKMAEPTRQMLLREILKPDGTVDLERALAMFLSHIAVHVMKIRHLETRVGLLEVKLLAQSETGQGMPQGLRVDLCSSPPPTEPES